MRVSRVTEPTADQAYAACARITRRAARNFAYGIRLLPRPKRDAVCAVYALARRIDDIGDGASTPPADKTAQLAEVRAALHRPADPADPVMVALADAAARFPIPMAAFDELIDGVSTDLRMDTTGTRLRTFAELETYCRCVAGSVGRLCLGVYGVTDPRASRHADELGIALQQVNILRDVREDLAAGRIYLPGEDLDRFGVSLELDDNGDLVDVDGRLADLVRMATGRAQDWYRRGLRLLPALDRRSAACTAAMAGIYGELLARIRTDPTRVYDRRLSLSGLQKSGVAARALTGRVGPGRPSTASTGALR